MPLPPQFVKKGADEEPPKGKKKGKKKRAPSQRAAMVAGFLKGRK